MLKELDFKSNSALEFGDFCRLRNLIDIGGLKLRILLLKIVLPLSTFSLKVNKFCRTHKFLHRVEFPCKMGWSGLEWVLEFVELKAIALVVVSPEDIE